jgi:alkanesulfonate monooxygenase SsuD/methylene tetrahydromethanopterin reductase-like flavin-dependent oxidoreductase (luciferase family)
MAARPTVSLFLPQAALGYSMLRERAQLLERLGYDALWIADHMWARGAPDLDFLEGWTAVAGLAEATKRLRLGVLVTCNSYRNPGILAKVATTADHVSGGRVELGLGAGWMEEEYRAYGLEFPPVRTRLAQLEESLEIIASLFTKHRTSLEGRHYHFNNAPFEPKPLQTPMPITLAAPGYACSCGWSRASRHAGTVRCRRPVSFASTSMRSPRTATRSTAIRARSS